MINATLGGYQKEWRQALRDLNVKEANRRIWAGDYTLWKPVPTEISNRLGWLRAPENMQAEIPQIEAFVDEVKSADFTYALLLGMGGSSLAPEVLRKCFGVKPGFLDLDVLDTTDPAAVLEAANRLDPEKTMYIVSTKSGSTVETASMLRYFYNLVVRQLGEIQAGRHFCAITDPGSEIARIAETYNFARTFLNDPNIGGRFAALSFVGLVPAALTGIDLRKLLERAAGAANTCKVENAENNPGAELGAAIGSLAIQGRDKLTLIASEAILSFGDWLEQLIAESTGKDGMGILPVVGEPIGNPEDYGNDRLFVYLHMQDDLANAKQVQALENTGFPVIRIALEDQYDLAGQFFLWEFATSIAGTLLGVQPFNQPDVESAKAQARTIASDYQRTGQLSEPSANLSVDGVRVSGEIRCDDLPICWDEFLKDIKPGCYLAIQAYIPPSAESDTALLALRTELRKRTKVAVTSGYGPRYLHSTGQLHKGDAGNGFFIQITYDASKDAPIPESFGKDESRISFGVLERAQALGDWRTLVERNRKVIRFHIDGELQAGLKRLIQSLPAAT